MATKKPVQKKKQKAAVKKSSTASVKKSAQTRAARPKEQSPMLRPVPLYEFTAGGLTGYLRLTPPERGLQFTGAVEGKALPAHSVEVLSLRHYLAKGEGGLLIPSDEAPCEGAAKNNVVTFSYDKLPRWPLSAMASYELRSEGGLEARFNFSFIKPIAGFEAAIGTIILKVSPQVYVHVAGRWMPVSLDPRALKFFPRNLATAELIGDGRWLDLRMAGIGLAVEPRGYDYPILVVRDERSGWSLVYMALTEECTSIWLSGSTRSIGMTVIGTDVKAKATISCRLRVQLCHVPELDQVLSHYREFVQEARNNAKK